MYYTFCNTPHICKWIAYQVMVGGYLFNAVSKFILFFILLTYFNKKYYVCNEFFISNFPKNLEQYKLQYSPYSELNIISNVQNTLTFIFYLITKK